MSRVSAFSLVLGPSLKHLEVTGRACVDSSAKCSFGSTKSFPDSDAVMFQDIAVPIALHSAQLLQLAEQRKKACACTSAVQPSLKLLLGWVSTSTLDCEHKCLGRLKDIVSSAVSAAQNSLSLVCNVVHIPNIAVKEKKCRRIFSEIVIAVIVLKQVILLYLF